MKKILLVYVPFCTPASPPYSLTNLYSFLKHNSDAEIDVLDLNLMFHKMKFPDDQMYFQNKKIWEDYEQKAQEYNQKTKEVYAMNNKKIVQGDKPEFFYVLLDKIKEKKPDIIAFSIVYSSQAFYAKALLESLQDYVNVIGGPAVNEKLIAVADKSLGNEVELLSFIQGKDVAYDNLDFNYVPDFSVFPLKEYFVPEPVIPLRTSSTCYYKQCTFCNHYYKTKYFEFPLETVTNTIKHSKQKYFFLIDDMIPKGRLLKIASAFKLLNIKWACQLKPTKDLDYVTLNVLKESGLVMVIWGVESGNNRILQLMKKGTIVEDVETVLQDSHKAGITNVIYIMCGFPTETQEEFIDTIGFLQRNAKCIDLVSDAVFGLQSGTFIFNNPKHFGITKVIEEQRTVLDPKIRYEVSSGLTTEEATTLRKKCRNIIENVNNYPKAMNFFREHMLCLLD